MGVPQVRGERRPPERGAGCDHAPLRSPNCNQQVHPEGLYPGGLLTHTERSAHKDHSCAQCVQTESQKQL